MPSDVCVHPERRCTVCLSEAAYARSSTSSFEGTSGLLRWGSLFIALQLLLWGASGNHSATLIEHWRGQTFFCSCLSLGFCVMDKSAFLHTPSPCKSKHGVQVWVCYQFTDARTVFLSSGVQNMDKQAERGWIRPEHRGGTRSAQIKQECSTGRVEISLKVVFKGITKALQ